jgi:folate-binding protein YgfZ
MNLSATHLTQRTAITIGGADRRAFLQSLVSNNVDRALGSEAVYAALLTPQGKFLHDMFILDVDDNYFLIDCEAQRAEDLLQRFAAYKLRSKVIFENVTDSYDIWALWGDDFTAPLAFVDPRLPQLGYRAFVAKGTVPIGVELKPFSAWDTLRLIAGIADGSRDIEVGKSTLIEYNFEYLNGIDFEKGCYVGQELIARMHHRRLGKKRLFPAHLSAEPGEADRAVFFRGVEAGILRSHCNKMGLALLPIDNVHSSILQRVPFSCGSFGLSPFYPDWLILD